MDAQMVLSALGAVNCSNLEARFFTTCSAPRTTTISQSSLVYQWMAEMRLKSRLIPPVLSSEPCIKPTAPNRTDLTLKPYLLDSVRCLISDSLQLG